MFVDQQVFANSPEELADLEQQGIYGDCWKACIATILKMPYEKVPHFLQVYGDNWFTEAATWSWGNGFLLNNVDKDFFLRNDLPPEMASEYVIAVGASPRGGSDYHAVVADTYLQIVHDPHPSRAGLVGDVLEVDYFTRRN